MSAGKAAHRELENIEGQPATRHSEHAPPVSAASPSFSRSRDLRPLHDVHHRPIRHSKQHRGGRMPGVVQPAFRHSCSLK